MNQAAALTLEPLTSSLRGLEAAGVTFMPCTVCGQWTTLDDHVCPDCATWALRTVPDSGWTEMHRMLFRGWSAL